MTYVEWGAVSDGQAEGWGAFLAGGTVDGVDVGQLEVATCCPTCAEAEFGGTE